MIIFLIIKLRRTKQTIKKLYITMVKTITGENHMKAQQNRNKIFKII
jgi:hypothetical protein